MDQFGPDDFKRLRRFEVTCHARALNFACFHDQPFLRSERACQWFIDLCKALTRHKCDLWAYCIMPTHVHLFVFPRSDHPSIGRLLESVKKSVTKRALAHVRAHAPGFLPRMRDEQPNGSVSYRFWQRGGGYDRNLWSPRAIWNIIDYIHRNPVEAGLCQAAVDWPWSSASYFWTKAQGPLALQLERLPADPR